MLGKFQYVLVAASPGMVSEVMAMEEMNPLSDAKRVEALMSSPLTHVKESTYPTAPQDLSSDREARKKEKLERLRRIFFAWPGGYPARVG